MASNLFSTFMKIGIHLPYVLSGKMLGNKLKNNFTIQSVADHVLCKDSGLNLKNNTLKPEATHVNMIEHTDLKTYNVEVEYNHDIPPGRAQQ